MYNIGAHEERTVLSVATDICSRLGVATGVAYVPDRMFNDRRYFIDCSKLLAGPHSSSFPAPTPVSST